MATPMLSILALYNYDESIFDTMVVPEDADRTRIIQSILIDNAELSLVYTDPEIVKLMIENWSRRNRDNWARIAAALDAEYSPIENYDRYEDFTDTSTQSTGTTRKVAGWNNDSSLTPSEGVDSSGSGSNRRTGHMHGNIGVTTAQQMITQEMELRSTYTLAGIISQSFKHHFCIQVY